MKYLPLLSALLICSQAFAVSFKDISKATVKVVRPDERSGGTGTVMKSSENQSTILTNNHVCEAVANGGLVITDDKNKYAITSYKQSKIHDLCLVNVSANLGVNTKVSKDKPEMYDLSLVSGHPSLYPTIVTTGHFSDKMLIEVMVGVKKCTKEDAEGGDALLCMILGGKPIVRQYETQVISATIKPGSSGSAVYNSSGELSGVVFAGSGELGYGMIVPLEYVTNFLNTELLELSDTFPNTTIIISLVEAKEHTRTKCINIDGNRSFRKACRLIQNNMLWVQE